MTTKEKSPALRYALQTLEGLSKQQIDTLNDSTSIKQVADVEDNINSLIVSFNNVPQYAVHLKNGTIEINHLCHEE